MFLIRLLFRVIFTNFAKLMIGSHKECFTVNFYSRFTSNTHVGRNCNFNGIVVRGKGDVFIGDNFHSGKNLLLINSYHQYEEANAIPYDTNKHIHKKIVIEDNVWIGDRVIILGGVTIGEGAIVQAGSVVVCDIPPLSIVGGNPAKVFKTRNYEDYFSHKESGRFC